MHDVCVSSRQDYSERGPFHYSKLKYDRLSGDVWSSPAAVELHSSATKKRWGALDRRRTQTTSLRPSAAALALSVSPRRRGRDKSDVLSFLVGSNRVMELMRRVTKTRGSVRVWVTSGSRLGHVWASCVCSRVSFASFTQNIEITKYD